MKYEINTAQYNLITEKPVQQNLYLINRNHSSMMFTNGELQDLWSSFF